MTEILAMNEVAVYRGGKEPVLQIDSFAMKQGELAALVAPAIGCSFPHALAFPWAVLAVAFQSLQGAEPMRHPFDS